MGRNMNVLFATMDDPLPYLIGGGGATLIALLGNGVAYLLTRKDKKENDLIDQFKKLLDREKAECDEKIDSQGNRLTELEKQMGKQSEDITSLRERLADSRARIRYLEEKCRDAGVKLEPWTSPQPTDPKPLGG